MKHTDNQCQVAKNQTLPVNRKILANSTAAGCELPIADSKLAKQKMPGKPGI